MQSQPKLYEVKFIYSEKATNFCEISTVDLSYVVTVKSTVEISKNFVAFSEYMNFNVKEEVIHENGLWPFLQIDFFVGPIHQLLDW